MLTLYDYLPSQNGYKVRLLLNHLGRPYRSRLVGIFDGEAQTGDFLAKNPAGAVPVLELDNGETLAESNAILCYLAEGTPYLPAGTWHRFCGGCSSKRTTFRTALPRCVTGR